VLGSCAIRGEYETVLNLLKTGKIQVDDQISALFLFQMVHSGLKNCIIRKMVWIKLYLSLELRIAVFDCGFINYWNPQSNRAKGEFDEVKSEYQTMADRIYIFQLQDAARLHICMQSDSEHSKCRWLVFGTELFKSGRICILLQYPLLWGYTNMVTDNKSDLVIICTAHPYHKQPALKQLQQVQMFLSKNLLHLIFRIATILSEHAKTPED